jgi:hypothetical protein
MNDKNKLKLDIEVNKDELEETADTLERIGDAMPNIVVRNNQNVYFTVNNWIQKEEKEESVWQDEEE